MGGTFEGLGLLLWGSFRGFGFKVPVRVPINGGYFPKS